MVNTIESRTDFYVYALFRADGVTPFYIGKGCGQRILVHEKEAKRGASHKDRIIQRMWADGVTKIPKALLIEGLTDPIAKQIEMDLIHLIGRWPHGPLANLTKGGDGVADLSPESKAKKSARNVASWSDPEVREKRSSGMKAVWTPERRQQQSMELLAAMTPERRAKMSAGRKKALANPEVMARLKESQSSAESRARKSACMKRAWENPETRKRRCEASHVNQNRPEYKEKRSKIAKSIWLRDGVREKRAASLRAYFAKHPIDEIARKTHSARLNSPQAVAKRAATNRIPEVRERRIAAQKAAFSTPEAKAKRSAASKAMWAAKKAQYALPSANEHALLPASHHPPSAAAAP